MNHYDRARELYKSCDGNTLNLNQDRYEDEIDTPEEQHELEKDFKKMQAEIQEIIVLLQQHFKEVYRGN